MLVTAKEAMIPNNPLAETSPPPCRGRAREGVETLQFHRSTHILTLQGGRNWISSNAQSGMTPLAAVAQRILLLRGQKVMVDADLAELYGVETKVLNQAVNYSGAAVFLLPPCRGAGWG